MTFMTGGTRRLLSFIPNAEFPVLWRYLSLSPRDLLCLRVLLLLLLLVVIFLHLTGLLYPHSQLEGTSEIESEINSINLTSQTEGIEIPNSSVNTV